jgi:ABC-type glycerol-3-phosphate transport system permease component
MRNLIKKAVIYIFLISFTIIWLLPLLQMILAAFKPNAELRGSPWGLPQQPTLEPIIKTWSVVGIERYFKNSVVITFFSVILTTTISSLAAYGFTMKRFRGKNLLFPLVLGAMMVPAQIILVPLYRLLETMGLLNTLIGIILVHTTWHLAFGIFLLSNFFRDIESEIIDAARIDGCSDFGIYRYVIMPLSLPALATLAIFTSTWIWNDFLFGLIFVQQDKIKPITVGIVATQGQYLTFFNIQSAAGLYAIIVPLLIFFGFQRYFIRGLSAGALKG